MEMEGLFQRHGDSFYSRDYVLTIPCDYVECPANRSQHCSMPSAIKISSGGQCKTGKELIELQIKTKKAKVEGYYSKEGD